MSAGARGPLRKTAQEHARSGHAGHRSRAQALRPRPEMPSRPAGLSAGARARWAAIGPELMRIGRLTVVDGDHFAAYCEAAADWLYWRRKVNVLADRTQLTPKGYAQVRPEVAELNKALEHMERLGRAFGLTPGARGDEGTPPGAGGSDEDDAAAFFGEGDARSADVSAASRPIPIRPGAG